MATVQAILSRKGTDVVSVGAGDSVLAAANLMNQRAIGGLVVLEGERVIGIFTERDVLRRVVAERREPATTLVADVMTTDVISCTPGTSLDECSAVMTARRVRHLPVVDESGVCGIVTSGDLMAFQVADQQATIEYLHGYVFDVR